jgi:peptidoglycan L-alanyl-D-glutamate endopeptidase CwlK
VDVAPFPIVWTDTKRFYAFGGFVLGVAQGLGIRIRWGGDWNNNRYLNDQQFNDLVHFELIAP